MEAVTVRAAVGEEHVEVVFSGDVNPATVRGFGEAHPAAMAAIMRHGRVLFDVSEVTALGFDPLTLGESMHRLARRGLRLAIVSTKPEFFGVGRQIAQYSGVEGAAINVFTTKAEAVDWLLGRRE